MNSKDRNLLVAMLATLDDVRGKDLVNAFSYGENEQWANVNN